MTCEHKFVKMTYARLFCQRCGVGMIWSPIVAPRPPTSPVEPIVEADPDPNPFLVRELVREDEPLDEPLDEQEVREAETALYEAWMESGAVTPQKEVRVTPIDDEDDTIGGTY